MAQLGVWTTQLRDGLSDVKQIDPVHVTASNAAVIKPTICNTIPCTHTHTRSLVPSLKGQVKQCALCNVPRHM